MVEAIGRVSRIRAIDGGRILSPTRCGGHRTLIPISKPSLCEEQEQLVVERSSAKMRSPSASPKCLSLEELCVRTAIDNLDFIRDVGALDSQFLKIILPHCIAEQLLTIEEATKGRDLSPITNELWLKCYKRKFGEENVKMVMKKMKAKNKFFKWKALYQAKLREQDELEKQCVKSLTEKYKAAGEQKASRQLQQIDLVPPPSKKRQFGSMGSGAATARFGKTSSTPSNSRGRLMKKARQEFAASSDAKRIAAARKKPVLPVRSAGIGGRR